MSVIASFYLYFVIEMFIFRGKMSVTVIPTTEWSTVKIEAESHASESWREDNIDNLMNKDLALIMSSMKGALAQVSDQLQFLWQIEECENTIVVKVREEEDEAGEDEKVEEDENTNEGPSIEPLSLLEMGHEQDEVLDDHSSDDDYNSENDNESEEDYESNFDYGGRDPKRSAKSDAPKVLTSIKLGRPRNDASTSKARKRGRPAKIKEAQAKTTEAQRRQSREKCDQVAKVIDALETDLAENFAHERLKLLFEELKWKYRSFVIAAVYLLPRGASPRAIKKFAFDYLLPVSEYGMGRSQINRSCAQLTNEGILTVRRKPGQSMTNTCIRYPGARFLASLPTNHPVNIHDASKCAAFQARYSVQKMCPARVKKGQSYYRALKVANPEMKIRRGHHTPLSPEAPQTSKVKKACPAKAKKEGVLKPKKPQKKIPPKKQTSLCPEALQTLKALTNEEEMESIKQGMSIKVENDRDVIDLD